jgi:hypothetical protein
MMSKLDEMFPKPPEKKVGAPVNNKNALKRDPQLNRTIRVSGYDWNRWKQEAQKADLTLSDWIRGRCSRG